MVLTLVTTYDDVTGLYGDQIFTFVKPQIAFGQLRRGVRDEFIKGNVTLDWLKEHKYIVFGEYDTVKAEVENYSVGDRKVYSCYSMVADLVGDDSYDD